MFTWKRLLIIWAATAALAGSFFFGEVAGNIARAEPASGWDLWLITVLVAILCLGRAAIVSLVLLPIAGPLFCLALSIGTVDDPIWGKESKLLENWKRYNRELAYRRLMEEIEEPEGSWQHFINNLFAPSANTRNNALRFILRNIEKGEEYDRKLMGDDLFVAAMNQLTELINQRHTALFSAAMQQDISRHALERKNWSQNHDNFNGFVESPSTEVPLISEILTSALEKARGLK